MTIGDLTVLVIVGLCVLLILIRPRGIGEGVWAVVGAAALLLAGMLSVQESLDTLVDLYGVAIFLIGLFWLSLAADRSGLIGAAADAIARATGGDGRYLLLAVVVFGVVTTALFSNDGTVVLLTPIVIQLCRQLNIDPLPYAFAVTFVADSASSIVPVANPVNILFAERLDLTFGAHVAYLALPTVVAVAVTTGMLLVVMRERIPRQIVQQERYRERAEPLDLSARLVALGLGLTVAGYLTAAVFRFSPYWITLIGGILVLLPVVVSGAVEKLDLVRVQPPGLYAFVAGLALIVAAVERQGLLRQAGDVVVRLQDQPGIVGVIGIGVGAAIGSNLINNWTMALVLIPPLQAGNASEQLIFAGLFGTDIGPNLTVVGSLATLIWITQLRNAGMEITAWTYLRLGTLTTIPALMAAMLTLALVSSMSDDYAMLPPDLPAPVDDGGADHLPGMPAPDIVLQSTSDELIGLAGLPRRTVIYCYPMTGAPDNPPPDGWDLIPGARGCTPQSCSFRDHYQELADLGVEVFGLSTQRTSYQVEAVDRLHLPFAILSDADFELTHALRLPTFEIDHLPERIGPATLLKRLTMILREGKIEKVFYPVFPPDRNAHEVIGWLRVHPD